MKEILFFLKYFLYDFVFILRDRKCSAHTVFLFFFVYGSDVRLVVAYESV